MKRLPYIYLLLTFFSSLFLSCEKIELPSMVDVMEEDKTVVVEDAGQGGNTGGANSAVHKLDSLWGYYYYYYVQNGEVLEMNMVEGTEDGDSVGDLGIGTFANPYTVFSFVGGSIYDMFAYDEVEKIDNVWLCGYVVGYVNGRLISRCEFGAGNVATNIVLAGKPDEKDFARCVPVQLSSSSSYVDVRDALNLRDNPDVIGRKVAICGRACVYMGAVGMKNVKEYMFM